MPNSDGQAAGLFHFQKIIQLDTLPDKFPIHISADNRYKLFVNDQWVSVGPALGDIKHWNYQTIDLAPFLITGQNTIKATVWNEGALRPVSQFSFQTAFILQGASTESQLLNTDTTWMVTQDESYSPIPQQVRAYYAAGAGDRIDFNRQTDNTIGVPAEIIRTRGYVGFGIDYRQGWILQPSILPEMELMKERLVATRLTTNLQVPKGFPKEKKPVTIPANTSASLLLDQGALTNAYFTLITSKGKNAAITITYAESLYDSGAYKNNRNQVENKFIFGRQDSLFLNGQSMQMFTSLNYRTFRYVQVEVVTKEQPVIIEDVYGTFTGYPFEINATLLSERQEIQQMLMIGWRTARLCAVETYMDCPYYERLQYVGDTRIQHMVTYYNSGDDRLPKNTFNLMDQSRQATQGITLSRYPDTQYQVIPTYSLWYIPMLYDYMMYGTDQAFVQQKLLGTRQILDYFISFQRADGTLPQVPGWNFSDWVEEWYGGIAPIDSLGYSAMMDLHLLHALQAAIAMEKELGLPAYAALYEQLSEQLSRSIKQHYWNDRKGLYADTRLQNEYSQHTNSLAILAGLTDPQQSVSIAQKILADKDLHPASIYFRYYLHQALVEAGLGDDYLDWLEVWRTNMDLGMTTWGEDTQVENTRSDCHAWGSSPNVDFFRVILGIQSAAPGFQQVQITPHLGELTKISGSMPHPRGTISANYQLKGKQLKAIIELPAETAGTFIWKGETRPLHAGKNELSLSAQ